MIGNIILWFKLRLPGASSRRLAQAEIETLRAVALLAVQNSRLEDKLDEVIEALNAFSAIVGLEWKTDEKRWTKLQ